MSERACILPLPVYAAAEVDRFAARMELRELTGER